MLFAMPEIAKVIEVTALLYGMSSRTHSPLPRKGVSQGGIAKNIAKNSLNAFCFLLAEFSKLAVTRTS